MIAPNLGTIPPFLTGHPRWLGWKTEIRNDKPTKVPKSWKNFNAKSTDPNTWADFSVIASTLQKQPTLWDGIGITFGDLGNGEYLAGVDFDSCLNAQREITDWAKPLIEALRTYLEVSPSEGGLKSFFRCHAADIEALRKAFGLQKGTWGCRRGVGGNGQDHGPAIEVYLSARFFAVTGKRWETAPEDVVLLDRATLLSIADLVQQATGGGSDLVALHVAGCHQRARANRTDGRAARQVLMIRIGMRLKSGKFDGYIWRRRGEYVIS